MTLSHRFGTAMDPTHSGGGEIQPMACGHSMLPTSAWVSHHSMGPNGAHCFGAWNWTCVILPCKHPHRTFVTFMQISPKATSQQRPNCRCGRVTPMAFRRCWGCYSTDAEPVHHHCYTEAEQSGDQRITINTASDCDTGM